MSALVVFEPSDETARHVAELLAVDLAADLDELVAHVDPLGYPSVRRVVAAGDAFRQSIAEAPSDPAHYEVIVVVAAERGPSASATVTRFLAQATLLCKVSVAFVCLRAANGARHVLRDMAAAAGRAPIATLLVPPTAIDRRRFGGALAEFVGDLRAATSIATRIAGITKSRVG